MWYDMDITTIYTPSVDENCYLLSDGGEAAVIDPGSGDRKAVEVLDDLLSRDGLTLRYILLTHGHYDHVTGVPALCGAWPNAAVYLHPADLALSDPRLFPLKTLMEQEGRPREVKPYGDGDRLSLGGLEIEVLHTPGHTPGSVCLRCGNVLFTGDTLFAGSMGRTDFVGGKGADMMASLKRLGELAGDFRLYPGHGEDTTLSAERASNPYLKMAMEGRL